MKLCKEMVDGMGGVQSAQFQNFCSYCYTAYTTLRKNANLILNLFALMVDANIPDIRLEPDKAVLKVKERFNLEMSEEEAIRYFRKLIEDSMTSMLPVLMDQLHQQVKMGENETASTKKKPWQSLRSYNASFCAHSTICRSSHSLSSTSAPSYAVAWSILAITTITRFPVQQAEGRAKLKRGASGGDWGEGGCEEPAR